jgi:hypothetical protein
MKEIRLEGLPSHTESVDHHRRILNTILFLLLSSPGSPLPSEIKIKKRKQSGGNLTFLLRNTTYIPMEYLSKTEIAITMQEEGSLLIVYVQCSMFDVP